MPDQHDLSDMGGRCDSALPVPPVPGTSAAAAYGSGHIDEPPPSLEFNNAYRDVFRQHGRSFPVYHPTKKLVEISEPVDHPFMVGSQFHPEFKVGRIAPIRYSTRFAAAVQHQETRLADLMRCRCGIRRNHHLTPQFSIVLVGTRTSLSGNCVLPSMDMIPSTTVRRSRLLLHLQRMPAAAIQPPPHAATRSTSRSRNAHEEHVPSSATADHTFPTNRSATTPHHLSHRARSWLSICRAGSSPVCPV